MPDPSTSAAARDRPVVSVIIAAYRAERFLDEALRSARSQTLAAIEILVVDDGSQDGTAEIVRRHSLEDPRVRLIQQDHLGISAARNRGLAEARADLIAMLDADDVIVPTRLERQWSFLEANPDVAVLGSYGWHIGATGERLGVFDVGPRTRSEAQRIRERGDVVFLLASSVMMRRQVIVELGGFTTSLKTAEDAELWTRVADNHVCLVIPERLVLYRVHPAGNSATRFLEQQQVTLLIRENAARRRAGRPEITLEELRTDLAGESLARRIWRLRTWRSRYWYRRAGGSFGARAPQGILWLIGALAIAPDVVLPRLWRQVAPLRRGDLGRHPMSRQ